MDWGRRALHLRRADPRLDSADQVQDNLALFDGADPQRSFYLSDDSYPQNLRFSDGSDSGIRIVGISNAGASMHVSIKMEKPQTVSAAVSTLLLEKRDAGAWLFELLS